MKPLTKDELLTAYSDAEERQKIFRLAILSDFLSYCLIARDYKPSTNLNNQIKLTPYGNDKVQAFARKRIPIPEARAICFLEFSWIHLLVDVKETDVAAVQGVISQQIRDRAIYFPFVFGRELYDRAYENLDPEKRSLDPSDTLDFLKDTPQGVFQMHEFVTGPFGLLNSKQLRFFQPQRHAGLLHCGDVSCHEIHNVDFATASEAPINKHRGQAVRTLQRDSEIPSAWASFISDIFSETVHPARDNVSETLIPILGDCLTGVEIRELTAWLLDNTQGDLRAVCASLGLQGPSKSIVGSMGRAELMQLCLTMSDREITQGIDTLVHESVVEIPRTEIRRPPINGDSVFGTFRMSAEIGNHGVRIRSEAMHLAPLRLRNLVERMYRLSDEADRDELEWQLRAASGETLEARLENYLMDHSPKTVVQNLVLARKSNVITACELLSLREGAQESEDFIALVLWKLGFASETSGDPHADFWRHHEEMEKMSRMGPGGPMSPSVEEIRKAAGAYFPALENVLEDALCFSIWALSHDHVNDRKPFIFEPSRQLEKSFEWLQAAVSRSGDSELLFGEKNTLYPLCRGFQCLASELKRLAAERDNHVRPASEFPDWVSHQSLQRFPFEHLIPFLDLTDDSREAVLGNLHEISRMLVSGKVCETRNDLLHGGRKDISLANVRASLSAIRSAVQLLEDCGFARVTFATSNRRSDGYGRSITTLRNMRGATLDMHNPSPFSWLGLPSTGGEVHIMTAACFSAPNDFLRFQSESNSPYTEMWGDFPKRKPRSQRVGHALEGVTGAARGQGLSNEPGSGTLS
ncbi:hypothetical protein [Streptomyces sp. NBC_01304]|uniref:hypothetical protein n=1 Tax=Streptomyces sp. NBC_01304 TaxID=2903818 RepID=UPI002E0D52EF|nr:hypothetical protein OG430_45085 [Streptomyces sp. NBC_01304]